MLIFIGILITIFLKYKLSVKTIIVCSIILCILSILMLAHIGCQEKIYSSDESPSLNKLIKLCPNDPTESIKYTRYFGIGTYNIIILIIIYIICNKKNFRGK